MKKFYFLLKRFSVVIFLSSFMVGCIGDNEYSIPEIPYKELEPNFTIEELVSKAGITPVQITEDKVMECYVVSSDFAKNIYKSLYLVSKDGKKGVKVGIDQASLFTFYPQGAKVYIKLKDLYFAKLYGQVQIGIKGEKKSIGLLPIQMANEKIVVSSSKEEESKYVNKFKDIKELKLMGDNFLNTFVQIEKVQFKEYQNKTYYNPKDRERYGSDNVLEDKGGNTCIVRVSSFATFGKENIAAGSGSVKGVLTKYKDVYQILVMDIGGINFSEERF